MTGLSDRDFRLASKMPRIEPMLMVITIMKIDTETMSSMSVKPLEAL
jgi:hypothetical protein